NRAVVNGRLNLQKMLDTKMERLQRECTEESGMDATASDAFRTAARALKQQIQVSAAREMKEETIDGTVTAYALMQISPRIIMTQLEQNEDLYTRFLATKPFESLNEDIKKYEAYKQALQPLPVEQ
ncbi:MAG TPA: hypothetical protein VJ904_03750, partial [Tichowtungia sp.]|nr:hypothetical protein [Tichowtungia sp.]